jgi:hypothetical protein
MTAVEVNVGSAVVKLRRPWVVGALSLIPFYWVFWYYAVNREMRDFGRGRGDADLGESQPWVSVLAVTIGSFLLVPNLVSECRAVLRLEACERLAGTPRTSSALIFVLLVGAWLAGLAVGFMGLSVPLLTVCLLGLSAFIAATVLLQRRLNRLWVG